MVKKKRHVSNHPSIEFNVRSLLSPALPLSAVGGAALDLKFALVMTCTAPTVGLKNLLSDNAKMRAEPRELSRQIARFTGRNARFTGALEISAAIFAFLQCWKD